MNRIMDNAQYGIELLTYSMYKDIPGLKCCFTTRQGGVSPFPCDSLNLSFTRENTLCGANRDNVLENYKRVATTLGVDYQKITVMRQGHGNRVLKVTEDNCGVGIVKAYGFEIGKCDGMITDVPGVTLCTIHGDCVPVVFADVKDDKVRAIGAAHSGWKGTVLHIVREVIDKMKLNFGTDPADLKVCIGPRISGEAFEIENDVLEEFSQAFDFDRLSKGINIKGGGKYNLDLAVYIIDDLEASGVKRENIELSDMCTYSNPARFFSHRRDKGRTGAMGSLICFERRKE